ncbi:hypothetical protein BJ973_000971 [Actinoplanes tereljensis]|uniref:TIR domain-containing protein n=1 Tax=Paractinoplanes tereljensis TaxID=571912 RepID=A0A919U043_9ACTN|nr:toll/interleukin-1 receptor domain-containing protein [Actinoplanes tereljensis]GIF26527.1 hypothetical protein Ate02nite_92570 [Actinoplanes tereljensis]
MRQRYDYFVSFAAADADWAEWIAAEAERSRNTAGEPATVLFQHKDFVPGSNWVDMIHKGIERSERIIPVLSPTYLAESPFGTAEWQAAWPEDPNGENRRVVPVRVRECDPAGLLGPVVYIDLVGQDQIAAAQILADGLFAAVHGYRPRRTPRFPGTARQEIVDPLS